MDTTEQNATERKGVEHAWLTVPQAAAILQISKGAVYELVKANRLEHRRFGRTVRIPRHAVLPDTAA